MVLVVGVGVAVVQVDVPRVVRVVRARGRRPVVGRRHVRERVTFCPLGRLRCIRESRTEGRTAALILTPNLRHSACKNWVVGQFEVNIGWNGT